MKGINRKITAAVLAIVLAFSFSTGAAADETPDVNEEETVIADDAGEDAAEDSAEDADETSEDDEDISDDADNKSDTEVKEEDAQTEETADAAAASEENDDFTGEDLQSIQGGLTPDLSDPTSGQVVVPDEDAAEEESIFTQQEIEAINGNLDYISSLEVISAEDAAETVREVDAFTHSSGSFMSFSLTPNALSSISLESRGSNSAEDVVYVLDKDAVAFRIVDEDGNGIGDAVVTIRYTDRDGKVQTIRTTTSNEDKVKGIAAFSGIEDMVYGLVDVQAKGGYKAVTLLEEKLEPGNMRAIALQDADDDGLYLRTADLEGKDLLYEDTEIDLVSSSDKTLVWSLYISKTGNAELPDTLQLYSETRNTVIATFDRSGAYDLDENTRMFTLDKNWLSRAAGLLTEGDRISVRADGFEEDLSYLSVKNAAVDQAYIQDGTMPIGEDFSGSMPGSFPSSDTSNKGGAEFGIPVLNFKISVAFFTDGSFIAMASYDFQSLSASLQKILPETDEPKAMDQARDQMNILEKTFNKNFDKIEKGYSTLAGSSEKVFGNYAVSVSANITLMYKGKYQGDGDEKLFKGTLTIAACLNGSAGYTWYWMIPTAIGTIPVYAGAELSLKGSIGTSLAYDTPSIFSGPYSLDKDSTANVEIEFKPTVSLFAGVGIHGMIGAEIAGYANFIAAIKYRTMGEDTKPNPHKSLSVSFAVKLNINLVLMTIPVTFYDGSNDPIKIKDNWDGYSTDGSVYGSIDYEDAVPLDLSSAEEPVNMQDAGDNSADGLGALTVYSDDEAASLASQEVNGTHVTNIVDMNTLKDNQIQVINTAYNTLLFRLVVIDGHTRIIYQKQNSGGATTGFSSNYYVVNVPDGEDVFEFSVEPDKSGSSAYGDYVYISAVCGDTSETDVEARGYSTSVCVMTVNTGSNSELQCETVSPEDEKGHYYYHDPMALGDGDKCYTAYVRSDSVSSGTTGTNILYNINGKCRELWDGKMFSTGVLSHNSACIWTIDNVNTEDNILTVRGWNMYGMTSWQTGLAYAELDVSGWDYVSKDDLISCWYYFNGVNYMVINGNVYYLDKEEDPSDLRGYSMHFKEVTYTDGTEAGLSKSEATYQMLPNDTNTALNIISVCQEYDLDSTSLDGNRNGSKIKVVSLIPEESSYYGFRVKLHGPLDIEIPYNVEHFTAVFATAGTTTGLNMVFTTPGRTDSLCNTYQWFQNTPRCMTVTKVCLDSNVITNTDKYLSAWVTYQNIGYMKEGPVSFRITDETGTELQQYRYSFVTHTYTAVAEGETYWNAILYTGDTDNLHLYFAANPDWETNKTHTITVEVKYPYASSASESVTLEYSDPYFEISGEQNVIDDEHVAEITVENTSVIEGSAAYVLLTGKYADGSTAELKTVDISSLALFNANRNDGELTEQKYNTSIPLEEFWQNGRDDLVSITVTLVDENKAQLSNNSVILENPYYGEEEPTPTTTPTPTDTPTVTPTATPTTTPTPTDTPTVTPTAAPTPTVTPTVTVTPTATVTAAPTGTVNKVNTGDTQDIMFYMLILLAALGAGIFLVSVRRKR